MKNLSPGEARALFDDFLFRRRRRWTRPDGRQAPGLEADLRRRGAGPQGEIAMLGVLEEWVGKDAVLVLTHCLPLGEAPSGEQDRLAGGAPVEVPVKRANVEAPALAAVVPDRLPL